MTWHCLKGFHSYVYQRSDFCLQRILSCKKAGSVLREARDRVVSLVTDAKAKVLACHVSIYFIVVNTFFSKKKNCILLKRIPLSLSWSITLRRTKSSYTINRQKLTFSISSFLFNFSHESVNLKQKPFNDSDVVLGLF